jgi:hypothetical protein
MADEPYRCENCNDRIEEGTGRFFECCAMDLCRKCKPYHADICPILFMQGRDGEGE